MGYNKAISGKVFGGKQAQNQEEEKKTQRSR